jgi:hypothetical protein
MVYIVTMILVQIAIKLMDIYAPQKMVLIFNMLLIVFLMIIKLVTKILANFVIILVINNIVIFYKLQITALLQILEEHAINLSQAGILHMMASICQEINSCR